MIRDTTVIIPSRGDERLELLTRQAQRLAAMDPKIPVFCMDYLPKGQEPDLIPRIKKALELVQTQYVVIIEDDDYYPPDYLDAITHGFKTGARVCGIPDTIYYHIGTQQYQHMKHPNRASLFCTAFAVDSLYGFKWPEDHVTHLDLELWKYWNNQARAKRMVKPYMYTGYRRGRPRPVGIKHGIGLSGGIGHYRKMQRQDSNWAYLRRHCGVPESEIQFFSSLLK